MVLAAHFASAGFPPELRGPLWAACSGASYLRSTSPTYFSLLASQQSDPSMAFPTDRLVKALVKLDSRLIADDNLKKICSAMLLELGEELAFWTVAALVVGDEPGLSLETQWMCFACLLVCCVRD